MANALHERLAALAVRLIGSHGRLVSVQVSEPVTGQPWLPASFDTEEHQIRGVCLSAKDGKSYNVNGATPTASQRVFLIDGSCPVEPKRGMKLLDGVLPAVPPPVIPVGLTDPLDGAYLGASSARTFTWTAGEYPVELWELVVGSAPGTNNFHSSGALAAGILTASVVGLPTDGSPVYARLGKLISGAVTYQYYEFTSGADPSPPPADTSTQYSIQDVEAIKPGETVMAYKLLVER